MKRLLLTIVMLFALAVPAAADDFADAAAAIDRGDYTTAYRLLKPLADQGSALAQFGLGNMYDNGEGVPQDYAEAMKWYRLAAEQGYDGAQYNLGWMYHHGDGVPQDFVQAHKWYNLAAASHTDLELRKQSADRRDQVARRMTPPQIAEAQRLAAEWHPKPE